MRRASHAALARGLADRVGELRAAGAEANVAERRAFEEFLAREAGWPELYPDFVKASAPERRRAAGVYYTPPAVAAAQVRLVADVLQTRLGVTGSFSDPRVLTVDPAAGGGAYPLAVRESVNGAPCRFRLFEALPGAACLLRGHGFDVAEVDAVAAPLDVDAPIVVCLGNPPYRRTPARGPLSEFGSPQSGAHRKNLYNDYVYFWRWALAAVFEERPGPGLVSFVSAASYLRGPAFDGMRRRLRCQLDELWIVDLEGDPRAARHSDNVFPIRTPVAIAVGVRYAEPRPDQPAAVHYTRLGGPRDSKLATLEHTQRLGDLTWQSAGQGLTDALAPRCPGRYAEWPRLTDLFPWHISGAQFKRTWPIGPTPEVLRERWHHLLALPAPERALAFRPTRDRDLSSSLLDVREPTRRLAALANLEAGAACMEPVRYAYRSFDRQWVLPDARVADFPRPSLWRILGPRQVFVTSLLTNVLGPGPAVVATALVPDLDHFRGSFGARAVIPLWRDAAATVPNVNADWLRRLSTTYGFEVSPETLLAYCYALLGGRSYVGRFFEELRTPGPHVPLTADPVVFREAAALGERLLAVHTYRCVPTGRARCVEPIEGGYPTGSAYAPAVETLHVGSARIERVAPEVWQYTISGLRVVPAWLRRRLEPRAGSPLDAIVPYQWTQAMTRELLELLWLIEMTLALEPALDRALDEVVSGRGGQLPAG